MTTELVELADRLEQCVSDWSYDMKDAAFAQLNQFPDELRALASRAGVPDGFVLVRQEAIDWLNGESDFECPPDRYFRGEPPRYWWRSVFREKAGLAAAPRTGGGGVK